MIGRPIYNYFILCNTFDKRGFITKINPICIVTACSKILPINDNFSNTGYCYSSRFNSFSNVLPRNAPAPTLKVNDTKASN